MNRQQLSLSALHLTSKTNVINADLNASYDPSSTGNDGLPNVALTMQAALNPNDFAYFLTEAMMKYVKSWKTAELTIDGNYVDGKGNLQSLKVKTNNSQLSASGTLKDILDPSTISWQGLAIQASIGSDFKNTMAPFIGDIKIPPAARLKVNSTGNLNSLFVDGNVNSTWGNVKAKGTVNLWSNDIGLDMNLSGEQVQISEWTAQPWLGPVDLIAEVKGKIGQHQDAQINGVITSIVLQDHPVHQISFQSLVKNENIHTNITIGDPRYRAQGYTDLSLTDPMLIANEFHFDTLQLGRLLNIDSTLSLTGNLAADITIDASSIEGRMAGNNFLIKNHYAAYSMDTLNLAALFSPTASHFDYFTKDGKGNLTANFDLKELPDLLAPWMKTILYPDHKRQLNTGSRALTFDLEMNQSAPLQLLGIDVDAFSTIHAIGQFDEENHTTHLNLHSGKFAGYGISLDTLYADIGSLGDSIGGKVNAENLLYNSIDLGNLNFDVATRGDTTTADLLMSHDSAAYLGLGTSIVRADGGAYFYPYRFRAFHNDYHFDPGNPIFLTDSNVVLHHFLISYDSMQIALNGDKHSFDANFRRLDLLHLNSFFTSDTNVIDEGYFNGTVSYSPGQLDLDARIDSLRLYHSAPLTITMSAKQNGNEIPFAFLLSNENTSPSLRSANKVDVHGKYTIPDESVDANLSMNITNPEMFAFLYNGYLDRIHGTLTGRATITGPVQKPAFTGDIHFDDISFTTTNPSLTFNIKKDSIKLDNSGLTLDHFTLYDKDLNPLSISGNLHSTNYSTYQYHFNIKANDYALINNPDTVSGPIKGQLVIDCDVDLSGNEKDTYLKAGIKVKDNTDLTYIMTNNEDVLLNTIGVVEFVDPGQLIDTSKLATSENRYDSIVANLPDFNLNSNIIVQDSAKIKVITDPQSGDFFEATGGANLELDYDRTGNPHLSGTYTIHSGQYRISFYDLVKKSFRLVPNSSINWSGSPESGEMDIKATYTVATNSLGLIGHEIGESEKATYKRTLNYIVGISIKGTLENPIITFSLDLPANDKTNFPVLANKLDRLRLPEFQSELNKQVFGLLVLGGFMPETSFADIDQSQVATTAIYNSVNALLASQLNRFASQHVKGVNIDVGIQSYSDYSTPGGKTQTAMDFRVSKSVFNDRLSFEVGGDFNISADQSGSNTGDNYRGDVAIIYDLTGNGDKQLKAFNNESYDIIYQEIRNTGISLIFVREFDKGDKAKAKESDNHSPPSKGVGGLKKAEAQAKHKENKKKKQ